MTLSRFIFCASILVTACSSSSGDTPAATTTPPMTATSSGGMVENAPPATTPAATTSPETAPATTPETAPATTPETAPATTPEATPPATPPATPATAAGDVARGRTAFNRVCGRCHEDGESDGPAPNRNLAEDRLRSIVRQGSGRMRAIPASRLSDADLTHVVAFLRSTHAVR
ncbi:MAG: cytochrome c [Polyangiales bacterium]